MRSNWNDTEQPARPTDPAAPVPDSASASGGKSSFDDIYDQPDPRAYYRTLGPYEYQIPHHAQQLTRRLLGTKPLVAAAEHGPVAVLDLCCSYGLNAALLNHTLTLDDLYRHYAQHDTGAGTANPGGSATARPGPGELLAVDREFYAAHRRYDAVRALGLDAAANAVGYARDAGLLEEGHHEDLERHEPSDALKAALGSVSLITVSGGVGYVTERTFARLVRHLPPHAWVLALVLRTVGYEGIVRTLAEHGLTTVRGPGTHRQRRFTSAQEQRHAVEAVRAAGLTPEGFEADGHYHAELWLSGPGDRESVAAVLDEVAVPDGAASG